MKNIRFFLSENFSSLVVKFSICLNRRVFELLGKAVLRDFAFFRVTSYIYFIDSFHVQQWIMRRIE